MITKVPPDGGWAWMIAFAFAMNNLATVPIMQGFGLIFKDTFAMLKFSAADGSTIINVNMAFGMILGLVNGPLLRSFGYRKIAVAGSLIYSLGIIATAFANTFALLIITYGIMASIGMGLSMSAFSFAFNSYFAKKRTRAMGISMTILGLGPIFMPQVASRLLSYYGVQGTVLLLGSYSLHTLIACALLQPIKWHLKKVPAPAPVDENKTNDNSVGDASEKNKINSSKITIFDDESVSGSTLELGRPLRKRKATISSIDHDNEVQSIYGFDTPLPRQLSETIKNRSCEKSLDMLTYNDSSTTILPGPQIRAHPEKPWWSSNKTVNLGSSLKIFDENGSYQPLKNNYSQTDINKANNPPQNPPDKDPLLNKKAPISVEKEIQQEEVCANERKRSWIMRFLHRVSDFYDLELMKDPIYVNIMLGLSIAIFAEINFSMLTPFILDEMGLSTVQIANVMSLVATVDLVCRGLAPFVGEWLRQPPRTMYLYSLVLLIISRTGILFTKDFTSIMCVAVGLGLAKGIRSVYMSLVVPSYVPIHRLPYASGIQMVINGIILLAAGPLLGVIRDVTGSYASCIIIINCVTGLTVTMWTIEMIIRRRTDLLKQRKAQNDFSATKT